MEEKKWISYSEHKPKKGKLVIIYRDIESKQINKLK